MLKMLKMCEYLIKNVSFSETMHINQFDDVYPKLYSLNIAHHSS